jgi:Flp pilus assembly protein TadG
LVMIMKKLDDKGNIVIIFCLVITGLLGFTAYVADIGMVYAEKIKLSNALDSAALAAVLELPNDDAKAVAVAQSYLEKNGMDSRDSSITIGGDLKSIKIDGVKNVEHLFAPVIGINSSNVDSNVTAVIGPAKSINSGIRPFAVQVYDFSFGTEVTLKEDAGSGYSGNYGAVALGGRGSSVFESNSLYGYSGTITVGDYIDTETGNMAGATNSIKNYIIGENSTFDNFPRDSIRLWTLPLVDTLQVNGRGQIQVVGFGEFYVESVSQKSGKIEVTGRFIKYVANAQIDMSLNDTGTYGAKLDK